MQRFNVLKRALRPARAAGCRRQAAIAAAVAGAIFVGSPVHAAGTNTADPVLNGQTDLSNSNSYSTPPTTTSDVTFSGSYAGNTTFNTNGTALNYGTLDDLDTSDALTITNNNSTAGSITLNTASNSVSPNPSDLLYIASGANLTLSNTSGQGALTLNFATSGNIDNNGTLTLGTTVAVGANTVSFIGSGATTVSGVITGTGTINFNPTGSGAITLTGQNSFTGAAVVNAGTLYLNGGNTSSGDLGDASSVTLNSGATALIEGNNSFMGYSGVGTVVINAGATLTEISTVTNHLGIVELLGGTLTAPTPASAGVTYGTYNLDKGVVSGGVATTSIISAPQMALTQSGGTVFNVTAGTTSSGIDLDVTGSFSNHGSSAGDNGLIKIGNGVMALEGVNTYHSNTTVNAGTLLLDFTQSSTATNIINNSGDYSALVMGGGTFEMKGSTTTANSQIMNGLSVSPGASSIVLISNGEPLLLNVGAMTSNGGTIDFTLPSGTQNATNGIVTSSQPGAGGIFPYATVGHSSFATVNASGDIIPATLVATNVPSGGLIPTASSTNIQIIGGFSGAYTGINGNTSIGSLTDSFAGTTIINPGSSTLSIVSGGLLIAPNEGPLFLGATPGTGTITAGTGSATTLVLNNNSSNNLTVNSVLANNGSGVVSLAASGTASVTLNAANTFTGTVGAGSPGLILQNALALQNATLASGNIVFSPLVASNSFTVGGLSGTFTQALTNSAGTPITLTFGANNQTGTFGGILSGAGTLVKVGSGVVTLGGYNTMTGGLVIDAGTIISATGGGTSVLGAGPVTVATGATLEGTVADSFGYTSGASPTVINIAGGNVTSGPNYSQNGTVAGFRITLPNITFTNGGTLANLDGNTGPTDNSGNFSAYGGTFTVNPSANIAYLGTPTTNTTVALQAGTVTFNVNRGTASSDLDLYANLINWSGGTDNIVKTGNGIMSVENGQSYTGTTTINGGTLLLDYTSPLAPSSDMINANPNQILYLGGGTLQVNGSSTQAINQTFDFIWLNPGASAIHATSNGQPVMVSITGTVARYQGATIDFAPPSGGSSGSNGIYDIIDEFSESNGILGGFATVNGSDWATIDGNGNVAAYTGYTDVTPGSAIPDGSSNNVRINGSSSGTVTLQNGSAGNTTSVNSLLQRQTSPVTIDTGGGILNIGGALGGNNGAAGGILQAPGAGQLTIGVSPDSGQLTTGAGVYSNGSSGGEFVVFNNSANPLLINSTLIDSGGPTALTLSGSGTVILAGTNTNSGQTYINTGTLQIGNGGTTGKLGSGAVVDNATLVFNRSDTPTFANAISGTGQVIQNGTGTITLSTVNSFTGGLVINAGTVLSTTSGGSTALGDGPVTVNAGGTLEGPGSSNDAFGYNVGSSPSVININGGTVTEATGASRMTLENLTFSNGGTLTNPSGNTGSSGNYSLNGVNGTSTITVIGSGTTSLISATTVGIQNNVVINVTRGTAASDLTITSVLSSFTSGKGITINGNGIVTLSGANTFNGGLVINGGTVISTHNNATGNGPVTLNSGATLEGNGSDALNYTSTLTINGGTVTEAAGSFRDTLGTITFANGGTINAPSTDSGDSSIYGDNYSFYGGTITVNSSPYTSLITGGSVGLQASNTTNGSNTFAVSRGSSSVDLLVSSILTDFNGSKGLIKSGNGFMSLAAANTYTGTTAVNGGVLLLNGSLVGHNSILPGLLTVNSGAMLAGTGTTTGAVTVAAGGVITSGATAYQSTGTLTVNGTTTLASGSGIVGDSANGATYLWKINDAGNSTGPGTAGNAVGWDLLALNTVAVSGTGSYVTIEPLSIGGGYVNQPMSNFNPLDAYQWKIATLSGGGGAALAAQLQLDTSSLSTFAAANNTSASYFSITDDPNDIYISYTPTPEPTGIALLGFGAAGMLLRRRRNSKFQLS